MNFRKLVLSVWFLTSLCLSGCYDFVGAPSTVRLLSSQNLMPVCGNDIAGSCLLKADSKSSLEPNLTPLNVAYGVSLFGTRGTYLGPSDGVDQLFSNIHHTPGLTQRIVAESHDNAGLAYSPDSNAERAIPRIAQDDEGVNGSVTVVNRTGWGTTACGSTGAHDDRIADCAQALGAEATWDGAIKGNSGQGRWRLVTRTGNTDASSGRGREVWRDERTGLLWSSLVSGGGDGKKVNWCKASGSNNILGNLTAQADPANICDNVAYQSTSGLAVSACFESVQFTDVDVGIDNLGKALLNLASSPAVAWRLPTFYDFQTANINGLRFVMPDIGSAWSTTAVWAASLDSFSSDSASVISNLHGDPGGSNRGTQAGVRCVGR